MSTTTKALRGGEFIVRGSEPLDVFMPEDFNDDQRMVRKKCIDFVAEISENAHVPEAQAELTASGIIASTEYMKERMRSTGFCWWSVSIVSNEERT